MIRQTITSYEDVITFGKYKGRTIDWISENNPGYIVWLVENEVVECNDEIYEDIQWADANNFPPEEFYWIPDSD